MNFKRFFWLFAAFCLPLTGCDVDKSLIPPIVEEEHAASYIIQVSVSPPTSYRTLDTWNNWTTPVTVEFVSDLTEGIADDDGDGDGHGEHLLLAAEDEHGEEILVGRKVAGDYEIALYVGPGAELWSAHDGELEEHHVDHDANNFRVVVTTSQGGHSPHGGQNIAYGEVHLEAEQGEEKHEFQLFPVQGEHGLRWESNTYLPYGSYELTLEAHAPSVMRYEHMKSRWNSGEVVVDLGDFDFSDTFAGGTIASLTSGEGTAEEIKITLRGGNELKSYGAVGSGQRPTEGNENISFSLRLEDDQTAALGKEALYYSVVSVRVINQESGKSVGSILEPCYGEDGFSYTANMIAPHGSADGDDNDSPDSDGDGHDDDH